MDLCMRLKKMLTYRSISNQDPNDHAALWPTTKKACRMYQEFPRTGNIFHPSLPNLCSCISKVSFFRVVSTEARRGSPALWGGTAGAAPTGSRRGQPGPDGVRVPTGSAVVFCFSVQGVTHSRGSACGQPRFFVSSRRSRGSGSSRERGILYLDVTWEISGDTPPA